MKFLKRHKDQLEVEPRPDMSKSKRKKDQALAKEEAISAYFTAVRPALAEKDVNNQAKEVSQKQRQGTDRREKEPSPIVDNAIPTVEPTDQASYLGFGGRGPCHESGSYISWSESIRAPSAPLTHPRTGPTINNGQLDSLNEGNVGENFLIGEVLHEEAAPALATVTQQMTKASSGRFQVSSLAPANNRGSRSHSLPQYTSSPCRMNLVDRAAKRRALEDAASPSSMPPLIPAPTNLRSGNPRHTLDTAIARSKEASLSGRIGDSVHSADAGAPHKLGQRKTDYVDPHSSSSLGRILEDCNSAFHEQRQAATVYATQLTGATPSRTPFGRRATTRPESYPTVQRIPTVRFSGVDQIYRPRVPELTAGNIYEQQEQRQYLAQQQSFDREADLQDAIMTEDDILDEDMSYDADEWEGPLDIGLDDMDFDPSPGDDLVELFGVDEGLDRTNLPSNVVANSTFWRPHKLY
jgi:hypothetical protein